MKFNKDNGIAIVVDLGVMLIITALVLNNPLGSTDEGQILGFGIASIGIYYGAMVLVEISSWFGFNV